jgi:hypothetical protein
MTPDYGNHHRLASGQTVLDEGREDRGVVICIAPHERLVPITLLRSRWGGLLHNGFLMQFGSRHR